MYARTLFVAVSALLLVSTLSTGVDAATLVSGTFYRGVLGCNSTIAMEIKFTNTSCANVTDVNPSVNFPTYRTAICNETSADITVTDSKNSTCDLNGDNVVDAQVYHTGECHVLYGPPGANDTAATAVGSFMYECFTYSPSSSSGPAASSSSSARTGVSSSSVPAASSTGASSSSSRPSGNTTTSSTGSSGNTTSSTGASTGPAGNATNPPTPKPGHASQVGFSLFAAAGAAVVVLATL